MISKEYFQEVVLKKYDFNYAEDASAATDYVELLAVLSNNKSAYITQAIDDLKDKSEFGFDLEGIDIEENLELTFSARPASLKSKDNRDGKKVELLNNIKQQVASRKRYIQNSYPFELAGNKISYSGNGYEEPYIQLLLFSQIDNMVETLQPKARQLFELYMRDALIKLIPASFQITHSGTANSDNRSSEEILEQNLINELGISWRDSKRKLNNSKDAKIDYFAIPKSEGGVKNPRALVLIFNVASGKNWDTKILESSPRRLNSFFNFQSQPVDFIVIPFLIRDLDFRLDFWNLVREKDNEVRVLDRYELVRLMSV